MTNFLFSDVQAKILEGDSIQVRRDATINLNCVINYSTNSTNTLILWYHNTDLLNYNKDVLTKSKLIFNKDTGTSFLHSNLRINHVDSSNSGNYTCKLTNAGFIISSNAVKVHVLNHGENPAAMNSYNKHRASNEFDGILDNSSTCCIISKLFYLLFFNLFFDLLRPNNL